METAEPLSEMIVELFTRMCKCEPQTSPKPFLVGERPAIVSDQAGESALVSLNWS